MTDFKEINRMTLWEYSLRIKAYNLKLVDREHDLHLEAWLVREAQAKKKKGKRGLQYIYASFKDFFDYDGRIKDVAGEKAKEGKPMTVAQKVAEFKRRKRDGEL